MTWKIGHDFFIWKLHKTSVIRSKQNKVRTIDIPKIHYFRAFSFISESAYDKLLPFSRIYYHKVSHHSNKTPFWTSVVVCQSWWGRSKADARGSQAWSSEWQNTANYILYSLFDQVYMYPILRENDSRTKDTINHKLFIIKQVVSLDILLYLLFSIDIEHLDSLPCEILQ